MVTVSAHAIAFDATKLHRRRRQRRPDSLPPGAREIDRADAHREDRRRRGPDDAHDGHPDRVGRRDGQDGRRRAHYASVAVCDVDADGKPDLVLGAPQAEHLNLTATGAVYVLLGKDGGLGKPRSIPANGNTVMELHFYGADPGDQLGAAVACADLNGDHVGDLIVAPGRRARRRAASTPCSATRTSAARPSRRDRPAPDAPDVTWATAADMGFGSILFAADLNGDDRAEILVASAPRSKKVHLLKNVTSDSPAPINVDGADHITFSGIGATAIAAGNLRAHPGGVDVVIGDSSAMRPTVTMGGGAIFGFPDVKLDATTQYTTPAMIMYGGDNMQFGAAAARARHDQRGAGSDRRRARRRQRHGRLLPLQGRQQLLRGDGAGDGRPRTAQAGPVAGGRFGASLAGTPTGNPPSYSRWDLIVGAPGTPRAGDRQLVGAAYLFGGGDGWLFPLYEQVFGAAATDGLGTVVAGGDVNGDKLGDLVTIAPNAAAGGTNAGVTYVVYGRAQP